MTRRTLRLAGFLYFFVALTLLGGVRASRAQLVLVDPANPAAGTLNGWYEGTLPSCFAARDAVALYPLADPAMDSYLKSIGLADGTSYAGDKGNGQIDGLFVNSKKLRISVRTSPAGAVDLQTLTHEYGHYVWFHLLSKDDRKRYRGIYRRQSETRQLISEYAMTNTEEGFAEAFAFYINQPDLLARRDAASFEFLAVWAAAHTPEMAAPEIALSAPAAALPPTPTALLPTAPSVAQPPMTLLAAATPRPMSLKTRA